MYQINRNNYHKNPKKSNIQTPLEVSQFIFELLKDKLNPLHQLIFDPCSGQGNLLEPWKKAGCKTFGNDIDNELFKQGLTNSNYDFLSDFVIN
jgi:type I restriction-modification system DNA methylase subunit